MPSRIARRAQLAPDVMQLVLRVPAADAMEFLQAALAGDPVPATQVTRMAH